MNLLQLTKRKKKKDPCLEDVKHVAKELNLKFRRQPFKEISIYDEMVVEIHSYPIWKRTKRLFLYSDDTESKEMLKAILNHPKMEGWILNFEVKNFEHNQTVTAQEFLQNNG